MKILVTGAAGFIGFNLIKKILKNKFDLIGLDIINDYYDVNLKLNRLKELGISKKEARYHAAGAMLPVKAPTHRA